MAEAIGLQLFSGPQCRLCDEAVDLVSPWIGEHYRLQLVDVTRSLELKKRYGLKIPVLRREDTAAELEWPFSRTEVEEFLR